MPCLPTPHLPQPPSLPFPLTLGITTPPINLDVNLCCKILAISLPPIPIGITIPEPATAAIITTAIKTAIAAINAYIDALPFDCPLE